MSHHHFTQAPASSAIDLSNTNNYTNSGVVIAQSSFLNNTGNVGTISIADSISSPYGVSIEGCIFSSNSASFVAAALFIEGAATISNSQFEFHQNTPGDGIVPLVIVDTSLNNVVEFSYCTFQNNTLGGLIETYAASSSLSSSIPSSSSMQFSPPTDTLIISNCKFLNNTAKSQVTISSISSSVVVDACQFNHNQFVSPLTYLLYVTAGKLRVSQSQFELNSVTTSIYGHQLQSTYIDPSSWSLLIVANSTFNDNILGGSIILLHQSNDAWIESCSFIEPSQNGLLQSITIDGSNKTVVSNCTFERSVTTVRNCNDTLVLDSRFGNASGVFIMSSPNTQFDSCEFIDSAYRPTRFSSSPAVQLYNSPNVQFTNCSFMSNGLVSAAEEEEEVVEIGDSSNNHNGYLNDIRVDNDDGEVIDANGGPSGGALSVTASSTCRCYGCVFIDNYAADSSMGGGALVVNGFTEFYCYSCRFLNNVADRAFNGGGGAVYAAGRAYFQDTLFEGNSCNYSSNGGGGAIYAAEGANVTIGSGCVFVRNTAQYGDGGAIYQFSSEEIVYARDIVFDSNYANNGGAIFVQESSYFSEMVISRAVFRNNAVCFDFI